MRSNLLRSLAVGALHRVFGSGIAADRALDRALRGQRDLSADERAVLARRVMGIACLRGRLAFILDQKAPGWRTAEHAWLVGAYALLEEGASPETAALEAGAGHPEVFRQVAEPVDWPSDPIDRLAAERSLPGWLAGLWACEWGLQAADALAQVSNRPGPVTLRANLLATTRERLIETLAAEGIEAAPAALAPEAVQLRGRANLFGSQAWRDGLFEVQDEASQLVARLAAPAAGETFVDFCAGAGGKTLAVAALTGNRGRVVALDTSRERLQALRARVARSGARVEAHPIPEQGPLPEAAAGAASVLVDAPCSSLGTLRRGPDLRWRLRPEELDALPRLQLAILERAAGSVGPAGRLVYATCTLRRAENEAVALAFDDRHPEFALEGRAAFGPPFTELAGAWSPLGTGEGLTLAPHLHGTDGFFACGWRRR